ncbi:hypothetical protein H2198_007647 [Neophaeococcomyces mojaviensis]|uniref:Uncharacterized protein n=1 Tax=Neophaeococcomyces mojaviensis TaxID=3383035 RepID=A0ACC2ZZD0_9EURO|nr:hypothetical protein H2198_007647 [Knufia sp. JES_112]
MLFSIFLASLASSTLAYTPASSTNTNDPVTTAGSDSCRVLDSVPKHNYECNSNNAFFRLDSTYYAQRCRKLPPREAETRHKMPNSYQCAWLCKESSACAAYTFASPFYCTHYPQNSNSYGDASGSIPGLAMYDKLNGNPCLPFASSAAPTPMATPETNVTASTATSQDYPDVTMSSPSLSSTAGNGYQANAAQWDAWSSNSRSTTTSSVATTDAWANWSNGSGSGKVTSVTSQSCATPSASTTVSCTTWHIEDAAAGYPVTSSCTTVVVTPTPLCTSTSKVTSVTVTTAAATWTDWSNGSGSGSGSVTFSAAQSCSTLAVSDVTSCSTWHIETAGYLITSSCTTFKATPSPVCAISTKGNVATPDATVPVSWGSWSGVSSLSTAKTPDATNKPISGSVTTITTSSCTTPAASTTTTCSTFHLEGTTDYPVTSSCSTWHIETSGYPITSSCTTYHLEATATFPITSSCAVVTATPLPVCPVVSTIVTVSGSAATDSANWSVWAATGTGAKIPANASLTGSGLIAKYTGAATVNAASLAMAGAAAVAAVVLA